MCRLVYCHLIVVFITISCIDVSRTMEIERDVIFTPNETAQVAGKIVFYNSNDISEIGSHDGYGDKIHETEQNERFAWLKPLKHALYLVLNNKINTSSTKSDVISAESLRQATFVAVDDENAVQSSNKFGDVINLSNGKFEIVDGVQFRIVELQPNCRKHCMETTSPAGDGTVGAFWIIHKVRHRDEERSFRYELKITVQKVQKHRLDGKRELKHNIVNSRSFLLRDTDYPDLFAEPTTKHEHSMDKRIFNTIYDNSEVPFQLNYRANKVLPPYVPYESTNNLNIGEYFSASSNALQSKPSNIIHQHEYVQAIKPQLNEKFDDIHQHSYFLNKNDYPIFKANDYHKVFPYSQLNTANALQFSEANQQAQRGPISFSSVRGIEILDASSQTPMQFPEANSNRDTGNPTRGYRGSYDNTRQPSLESDGNNNNQPQIFTYPHGISKAPGSRTTATTFPYETNTSPNSLFRNSNAIYANGLQSNFGYQADDRPYWYGYSNLQQPIQGNFIPSHRYQENTFSELDPIYHNPILVTPVNLLPIHLQQLNSPTTDTNPRTIAQLPIESVDVNSPTENYRVPSTENYRVPSTENYRFPSTDAAFTTPLSYDSPSQLPHLHNDANIYPDSINAQLPPPDSDAEVNVPYVEVERKPVGISYQQNRNEEHRSNERFVSTEKYEPIKLSEHILKDKLPEKVASTRKRIRPSTTQTPTTTFTPETTTKIVEIATTKRTRNRGSTKFDVGNKKQTKVSTDHLATRRRRFKINKPTTTTSEPFTSTTMDTNELTEHNDFTTTTVPDIEYEPRTSQSIQKSVSVRIGDRITVMPKQSVSSSVSSNISRRRIDTRKSIKFHNVENTTETASMQ